MSHFILGGCEDLEECLSLAGDGEIEVSRRELFGKEDDLSGVHFKMANNFRDRLEDCCVARDSGGLWIDDDEKALGSERADNLAGFLQCFAEAVADFA